LFKKIIDGDLAGGIGQPSFKKLDDLAIRAAHWRKSHKSAECPARAGCEQHALPSVRTVLDGAFFQNDPSFAVPAFCIACCHNNNKAHAVLYI